MNAQLKKGILEACILKMITESDHYGYDLVRELSGYFEDVSESAYYAILRRLMKNGLLECYYADNSNGPKRKYYSITDSGREYLEQSSTDLKKIYKILVSFGIEISA